jgi:hypothetical protein
MVAGRGGAALVAVMLSTSFVVGSSVGVVSAEGSVDTVATETGDALEVAGELVADAAPLSDVGDDFVAVVAGSEVELPADPAESLVLDGAAGEVGVDLPVVAGLGDGVVDESGAVVYESDTSPVSLAAQATEDGGMQVLVVIDGPDAPTEYRFDMTVPDGAVLLSSTDGGAVVVDAEGLVVAPVAPAWAVDANGQPLPTHYRIDGTTLVQVIDHHGAAYPVVGDPCWKCWGAAIGAAIAGGVVAAAVCGVTVGIACPVAVGAAGGLSAGAYNKVATGKNSELIKQPVCGAIGGLPLRTVAVASGFACSLSGGRGN